MYVVECAFFRERPDQASIVMEGSAASILEFFEDRDCSRNRRATAGDVFVHLGVKILHSVCGSG